MVLVGASKKAAKTFLSASKHCNNGVSSAALEAVEVTRSTPQRVNQPQQWCNCVALALRCNVHLVEHLGNRQLDTTDLGGHGLAWGSFQAFREAQMDLTMTRGELLKSFVK